MKPKLRVLEHFDPTPEEVEKEERARPVKLPLCLKCKLASAIPIVETAQDKLGRAFVAIDSLLKEYASTLRRGDIDRINSAHKHLSRAARGRYCSRCFDSVIDFSNNLVREVFSS